MRLLFQAIAAIWLLFLSFWVWLLEFNEYRDLSIIDCDKDAEAVFMLFLVLIWLTTLIIWGINLVLKYRFKAKPLWFIGSLSAALSIAFSPKFTAWVQYGAKLSKLCQ